MRGWAPLGLAVLTITHPACSETGGGRDGGADAAAASIVLTLRDAFAAGCGFRDAGLVDAGDPRDGGPLVDADPRDAAPTFDDRIEVSWIHEFSNARTMQVTATIAGARLLFLERFSDRVAGEQTITVEPATITLPPGTTIGRARRGRAVAGYSNGCAHCFGGGVRVELTYDVAGETVSATSPRGGLACQ